MALRADDVDLIRDRQLVTRFQAGDTAAFDDLYRRYFARLQRFCLRRVGDPQEAEELAQEAFAKALRAMPEFGGERRFYPWMTVIASRLCIDAARRKGRTTPVPEIDPGSVDDVNERVAQSVDRAHLAAALDRLAPRHREVLVLREQHGWSYQRIANHYGVSVGTVEALLHRARKSLRREFLRVSGGEHPWVAVPVLGWLVRRLRGFHPRIAELQEAASPLALKVASVVIAVGTAGLLGTSDPPPPSAAWIPATPATTAGPAGPAPVAPPAPPPAPAATPAAVAPHAPARGPVPARPHEPTRSVSIVAPERARTFNDHAPVGVGVGPYSVGVDPVAVVSGALELVHSLVGR